MRNANARKTKEIRFTDFGVEVALVHIFILNSYFLVASFTEIV